MHEKWAYFMPELVVRPQKIKVFGRPGGGYDDSLVSTRLYGDRLAKDPYDDFRRTAA